MSNKSDEIFVVSFNTLLITILEHSREIQEDLKQSDDEWTDKEVSEYVYAKLNDFYTLIQSHYVAEYAFAEKNHEHERASLVADLMKKSSELEDELDDMNMDQFHTFLQLYSPESSVDIFGTIYSAKKV